MNQSSKALVSLAALTFLFAGCSNPETCSNADTRDIVTGGSQVDVETECKCSGTYTESSSCCSVPGTNVTCCPEDATVASGLCRNSGDLDRETVDPGPGTMEDPNPNSGEPQIAIDDFNVAQTIVYGGVPFDIDVTYVNVGNGVLLEPGGYGFYKDNPLGDEPIMRMEQADFTSTMSFDELVPWEEIPLNERFKTEGTFTVPEGTYRRKLINLPTTTLDRDLYENGFNTIVD